MRTVTGICFAMLLCVGGMSGCGGEVDSPQDPVPTVGAGEEAPDQVPYFGNPGTCVLDATNHTTGDCTNSPQGSCQVSHNRCAVGVLGKMPVYSCVGAKKDILSTCQM